MADVRIEGPGRPVEQVALADFLTLPASELIDRP